METFSIREYAAKMRGVDYEKCWPFSEKRGGRSLPPMPVQKFRWWADELRAARSGGGMGGEAGDPGNPDEKAAAAVVAADAHEAVPAGVGQAAEERLGRTPPSRAKQRTPKKRSILELFAVAPPIRGVQEQDRQDSGGSGKPQGEEAAAARKSKLGASEGGDSLAVSERKKRVKDGRKMARGKIETNKKLKAKTKMMKKKKKLKVQIRTAKKRDLVPSWYWSPRETIVITKFKSLRRGRMTSIFTVNRAEQEKTCNLKISSPVDMCKILKNRVYEKQFGKMHKRLVHSQTKSATIRTLLKKHIFRLVRTSKLVSRNQEIAKVPLDHTVVKKRKRGTSTNKRKKTHNTKGSTLVELCCESAGTDGTLVHGKSCLPLELPHLQTLCKIVSDVLAASSTTDNLNKRPSITEGAELNLKDKEVQLNLNDRVVTSNVETGETTSEKQLHCSFSHATTTNSSSTKKTPLSEFLDLNHPVKDYVDLNCISLDVSTSAPSPTHSGDLKVLEPMNKVVLDSDPGTCQEQLFSLTSNHMNGWHNPIGKSVSVSNTKKALSLTRNQDKQHWISCLNQSCMDDSTDGQTHLMDPAQHVCNSFPEFQPMHHIPKDMVIGTRSLVGSKAIVDPSQNLGHVWREKGTEEGFIGLPLNSQGEFIQLHPAARYGFCEVDKMPRSALNSLQILPSSSHFQPQSSHVRTKGKFPLVSSCHEDDQNWFLKQYYPAQEVVISDLGSIELQGLEKVKHQTYDDKARLNCFDPRHVEFFCCGCKDHIVTENNFDRMRFHSERDLELGIRPAIQPTMRLMGQNVTVGSYSKEYQGCNDGKAWTDKETKIMNCPTIRVYNRPILKGWHKEECIVQADSGASREISFSSLESPSNYCCMSSDNLTTKHMHLGVGSNWMLNDGNSSTRGDHGFHVDLSRSPVPSQSFLNRASLSATHCTSDAQSVDIGQGKTLLTSYPQNFCQHMLLNSAHCKHNQTVSYNIPSTSHSPCINQVPTQTSRGHSLQKLPHWLLNAKSQHPSIIPCHPAATYQSCTIPGNSGFPRASPYPKPVISFPCGSSSSQTYVSYSPMSVVYPSSIAAPTTNDFSSVSSTYGDNIKAKRGVGFNFACVKIQDHFKRCRKRSATKDDKIMETVKRPHFKLQEASNAPTSARREQLHGDQKDAIGASKVNACMHGTIEVSLPVRDSEKDNVVVSGGSFPLKSNHTRTGPIKLSAGAKHILRPNGSLVQENSRPIYSTLPFTQGNSAGKDAVSQEQASNIYRF